MSVCSVMHVSNVKTAGVILTDPDLTRATRFCISEIRELQCGFPDTGAGSASERERERECCTEAQCVLNNHDDRDVRFCPQQN